MLFSFQLLFSVRFPSYLPRLGRSNLIPDHSSIFDYTLDVDKPGSWAKWADQVGGAVQAILVGSKT